MELKIREARIEDYDSLLPLFQQVHDLHVSERSDIYIENSSPVEHDFYLNQLSDCKQHIFVAYSGIDVYAVVVMREEKVMANSFLKARSILFINSLCVTEKQRGTGVGKMMMEFVFEYGRKLYVDSIELGVLENNKAAIQFYESIGLKTKSRKMEIRLIEDVTIAR
ncbi:MAG: GNAT family N-acetyltransferase [Clostridiales bacterium]|nr:GNAT family N-acetyltransferase [Clostridiales bacterium]